MATAFAGKWRLEKAENAAEFMKATDAPEEVWKKVMEIKPVFEFAINGNKWAVKSELMKLDHEFELGKEVDHTGPDGRKSKNISVFEGGKLITDSKLDNGKTVKLERWIEGDKMVATMSCGGVTSRNEFVKA